MEDKLKEILKKVKLNEAWLSALLGLITVVVVGSIAINYWKANKPEIKLSWWQRQEEVKENQEEIIKTEKKQEQNEEKREYTVKRGDHLWKIAEEVYGSGYNWVDIAKANKLKNPGALYVGQKLVLPKVEKKVVVKKTTPQTQHKTITGDKYKVQKGDNLWKIAVRAYQNGYKWVEIAKANKLANPNLIEVGQELVIPR